MSDIYNPSRRNYTKINSVELVELLTPEFYKYEDRLENGEEVDPFFQVINSNIKIADNIDDVLSVSSVPNTVCENIDNFLGISKFFIKQNKLTYITNTDFQNKILDPLGVSFKDFDGSSAFKTYLEETLLPILQPATSTDDSGLRINGATLKPAFSTDNALSSVHAYLAEALGWFYFLNRSGASYDPSTFVAESLASLYNGNILETVDGIRGLTEYIWKNYKSTPFFRNNNLIPTSFISGVADAILDDELGQVATYTSGTQKLENLQTLVDVVYSKLYIDSFDFRVKEAFDDYEVAGYLNEDKISAGPFRKLETILGLAYSDYTNSVEQIKLLYDITYTRDEDLQYIADLIGWKLRGNNPDKWRHQIRTAVDLYKRSGTLAGIQAAVNNLVSESILDISGKTYELWESYVPFLLWYALATESDFFKDLNSWTPQLATKLDIYSYSTSSLEDNIKIVIDNILLKAYKEYPENFLFKNSLWDAPRFFKLNEFGESTDLYTLVGEDSIKPFHCYPFGTSIYEIKERDARNRQQLGEFNAALAYGPLGYGVYAEREGYASYQDENTNYLKFEGDLNFVFTYRGKVNYPIPPFEEVKYYKDCILSENLIDFIIEQIACLGVNSSFALILSNYMKGLSTDGDNTLQTLSNFLLFSKRPKQAPNYSDVILNGSKYQKNILNLWNGKSSHLLIDFQETDFDFSKITLEGDSPYAFYDSARITKEFSPAHAIPLVNLNASAEDSTSYSSVNFDYITPAFDDNLTSYGSGAALANFELSGAEMSFATGGGDSNLGSDDGRGGLNTFKRDKVDNILDTLAFSSLSTENLITNVNRRAVRRRNYRYLLPKNGYYDRTGFNPPISLDPSVLEKSNEQSLGELTLGYIPSSGQFHPVVDPITPSGVWHRCEDLGSSKQFFGVYTSATFPYRGLSSVSLNNNAKDANLSPSSTKYTDRGQLPGIYYVMHKIMEDKAYSYATNEYEENAILYELSDYWKNNILSLANSAIDSGYGINSFNDYINFSFGTNLHKLFNLYTSLYEHPLGASYIDKTGANIFAHTYGKGLYNLDFEINGSATVTSNGDNYISTSFTSSIAISPSDGSGVFSVSAVNNLTASGTYIASASMDQVVPLNGTFIQGNPFTAEFRNPHILSGIEFVAPSGSPNNNEFRVFRLPRTEASSVINKNLIDNTLIYAKSVNGLPRLRFDLSSYGDYQNFLNKDHTFELSIKSLVGDDNQNIFGGAKIGVWIHTDTVGDEGYLWSWDRTGKWRLHKESDISKEYVLENLAHTYTFPIQKVEKESTCLSRSLDKENYLAKLGNVTEDLFKDFTVTFDTRNYTENNNYEYLKIIPVPDNYGTIKNLVHRDKDTNYVIEIFLVPSLSNRSKYLLIDSISFSDLTLKGMAGVPLGFGKATTGTPFKSFYEENISYLEKEQLFELLRFYNGLIGVGNNQYYSDIASRDDTLTSSKLEQSGGSRLNYRTHPDWVGTRLATSNKIYTKLEIYG